MSAHRQETVLQIQNTLTDRKEPFEPLRPPEVSMYVCGPTVYSDAHIGHGMSYIVFDVVRRYLEYKGYRVRHVQNFTDVDDKIINRARETGEEWVRLSSRYSEDFLRDMDALHVKPALLYPRASQVMPQIIDDISRLIERGSAYPLNGDVYFRVLSDPDYGKLSHRRLDEMHAGARVEVDQRKEHPMDFALWKAAKPGEPAWDSPWGPGRPGWHIECTTMVLRNLGEQVDIHGGGNDLVFPHHENEIAQSEQLTGKTPFARYWLHNGQLLVNGEKMSKSIGNVVGIEEILEKHGADAFRMFVLSSHYRRPINFTWEALGSAATAADRLAIAVEPAEPGADTSRYQEYRDRFEAAMDDDFNTSAAVAVLFELAREANRLRAENGRPIEAASLLKELTGVLGLRLQPRSRMNADVGPFVELLLELRQELRTARQYALSDRIRDGLRERGVAVEDTPEGPKWRLES